jgi:hypothetical protein
LKIKENIRIGHIVLETLPPWPNSSCQDAPKNNLNLLPDTPLTVGSLEISPATKCRNLGVLFDAGLTMECQVKSAAKSAFYHIRIIARIRRFLDLSATKTLVHAFVMSRLDYCNNPCTPDYPTKPSFACRGSKMLPPCSF